MSLTEVEIGPHTYQIRQLSAIKQLHIVRRLAPLLVSLGTAVDENGKPRLGKEALDNIFGTLAPAADILASMPDETVEYLLAACLEAVYRKGAKGFSPVLVGGANMFSADMDIGVQLQLVWEVGKANLQGFINTFLSLAPGSKAGTAA